MVIRDEGLGLPAKAQNSAVRSREPCFEVEGLAMHHA